MKESSRREQLQTGDQMPNGFISCNCHESSIYGLALMALALFEILLQS